MNYNLNSNTKRSNKTLLFLLCKQGIGLIGMLCFLSSSIFFARAEGVTPESTQQRTAPPTSRIVKSIKARKVKLKASQLTNNPQKPQKVTKLTDKSNSYNNRSNFYIADSGKNSYVDTTDYNAAPPPVNNPTPTNTNSATQQRKQPKVVITERKSGCSVVANGSQVANGCGGGNRRQANRTRNRSTATNQTNQNRVRRTTSNNTGSRVTTRNQPVYSRNQLVVRKRVLGNVKQTQVVASNGNVKINGKNYSPSELVNPHTNSRPLTVVSLPEEIQAIPLSEYAGYVAAKNNDSETESQVTRSNTTIDSKTAVNSETNTNPARKTALLYPLSIPARFSSPFGWRIHPITGAARMHAGTDIAAPLGTPVLATYSGRVEVANNMGGYGLTVTLRHADDTQESLYAHLSQILVQPGEYVEQGTVIGLVGSTGNSTGPHLHFEWRYLTTDGWVAVDAGQHLEYALDNLMQAMQMAKIAGDTNDRPTNASQSNENKTGNNEIDREKTSENKITDERKQSTVKEPR